MRDADPLAIDEATAEIRRGAREDEAREPVGAPGVALAVAAHGERGDVQRRRRQIQQTMHEAEAFGAAVGLAPIGEAGDGSAHGAGDADPDRKIRRARADAVAGRALGRIEDERGRPGAERQVGQYRMKRVPKPDTMNGVFDLPSRITRGLVRLMHGCAERVRDRLQPGLFSDCIQSCFCFRHETSCSAQAVLRLGSGRP